MTVSKIICAIDSGLLKSEDEFAYSDDMAHALSSWNGGRVESDALGRITSLDGVSFSWNSDGTLKSAGKAEYLYERGAQGDVLRVYDRSGAVVGEYAYDAYGNCEVLADAGGIASLNPFRYRGYYFDAETGLYYLNARYYDPRLGRFLSPDSLSYLDPSTAAGMNLYAYCQCDPVNNVDPTGRAPEWVYCLLGILVVAGAIALMAVTGGAAAPIFVGTIVGAVSGFVFGGIETNENGLSWNWTEAAKGFCWGAFAGAVGGAATMGITTFGTAYGLSKVGLMVVKSVNTGLVAGGLGAFKAMVEGEEWTMTKALTTFAFGAIGGLFGDKLLSSFLFGFGFSFAEGVTDELLDYYDYAKLIRMTVWSGEFLC